MSGIIAQNSGRHTGLIKAASAGGEWTLIETITASSDATISFTSGLDSTYDEYCFKCINLHPETDDVKLTFQGSTDAGSSYGVTITTTYWHSQFGEDSSGEAIGYLADDDVTQGTGFSRMNESIGNDNDQSVAAEFYLFNPASTTFVKNFVSNSTTQFDRVNNVHCSGYFNTASAIDAIQFKMSSGKIDTGTISLYGIG